MIGETYNGGKSGISFFWYLGVVNLRVHVFFATQLERLGPCTVGKPSSHVDLDAGAAWASASERQWKGFPFKGAPLWEETWRACYLFAAVFWFEAGLLLFPMVMVHKFWLDWLGLVGLQLDYVRQFGSVNPLSFPPLPSGHCWRQVMTVSELGETFVTWSSFTNVWTEVC